MLMSTSRKSPAFALTSSSEITVADQGHGLAEEDSEKIFAPFYTTKAEGMGIGLAICRSIAKAHQGSLTMSNAPQGGAVFCALLPVRSAK